MWDARSLVLLSAVALAAAASCDSEPSDSDDDDAARCSASQIECASLDDCPAVAGCLCIGATMVANVTRCVDGCCADTCGDACPKGTCESVCMDIYTCAQTACPGWIPTPKALDWFMTGDDFETGCLERCDGNSHFGDDIDPTDCAATVAAYSWNDSRFEESCQGTGGG